MRAAPREQIGLSLGAWGAVQATAAGLAIATGGVIRDLVLAAPGAGATSASPYIPVFALEGGLLLLAVIVALPLRRGDPAAVTTDGKRPCGLSHRRPGRPAGDYWLRGGLASQRCSGPTPRGLYASPGDSGPAHRRRVGCGGLI
jgi:hypothetical protein